MFRLLYEFCVIDLRLRLMRDCFNINIFKRWEGLQCFLFSVSAIVNLAVRVL